MQHSWPVMVGDHVISGYFPHNYYNTINYYNNNYSYINPKQNYSSMTTKELITQVPTIMYHGNEALYQ